MSNFQVAGANLSSNLNSRLQIITLLFSHNSHKELSDDLKGTKEECEHKLPGNVSYSEVLSLLSQP